MNTLRYFVTVVTLVMGVFFSPIKSQASTGDGVLLKINEYRAQNGLTTLVADSSLQVTSDVRAEECSRVWSHTRPDGSKYYTAGNGDSYGENLANGYNTAGDVVDAWVASPTHKALLDDARYTKCSVSIFERNGRQYVAAEFA